MKFIPNYRVCYNGEWYEADEEFEINDSDVDEMKCHGEVIVAERRTDDALVSKKRGRPGKEGNDDTAGEDATQD